MKDQIIDYCKTELQSKILTIKNELARLDESQKGETKSSMGDKFETAREMMQRERVSQRKGGNVESAIENQRGIKCGEGPHLRQHAQHHTAENTKHREQLLRRKPTVCDQPDQKRRDHRADGERAVGQADLRSFELERVGEISPHAHVPRAPYEVLEEHEGAEFYFERRLRGLHENVFW